jgi:hypothetical protein
MSLVALKAACHVLAFRCDVAREEVVEATSYQVHQNWLIGGRGLWRIRG